MAYVPGVSTEAHRKLVLLSRFRYLAPSAVPTTRKHVCPGGAAAVVLIFKWVSVSPGWKPANSSYEKPAGGLRIHSATVTEKFDKRLRPTRKSIVWPGVTGAGVFAWTRSYSAAVLESQSSPHQHSHDRNSIFSASCERGRLFI